MKTTGYTQPDELFDTDAKQENYPEEGNQTQTGAATNLNDEVDDSTDEDDDSLADTDD